MEFTEAATNFVWKEECFRKEKYKIHQIRAGFNKSQCKGNFPNWNSHPHSTAKSYLFETIREPIQLFSDVQNTFRINMELIMSIGTKRILANIWRAALSQFYTSVSPSNEYESRLQMQIALNTFGSIYWMSNHIFMFQVKTCCKNIHNPEQKYFWNDLFHLKFPYNHNLSHKMFNILDSNSTYFRSLWSLFLILFILLLIYLLLYNS